MSTWYRLRRKTNRKTVTDKLLRDKAFDIAQNLKYDGYQRRLTSILYNVFNKNTSGSGIKNIPNKELAEVLNKLIIRKFNKRKVHSPFIDNIWVADLVDMQSINKFNKEFKFFLCVIEICNKCIWVVPLKTKKELRLLMLFKKS